MNEKHISSWLEIPNDSDFPLQNIPFGVVKPRGGEPRCATRIGDHVIDLSMLAEFDYFYDLGIDVSVFYESTLNYFMDLGKETWRAVRKRIIEIFAEGNETLRNNELQRKKVVLSLSEIAMMMPIKIGDYTDFYSSIEHATNVGMMFRDPKNALMPNWKHLPVGYHGRSSSIVVSGTNIHRPKGQMRPDESQPPVFGPTRLMDFELEMGFVIGKKSELGESISTTEAEDHIFGFLLFNDLTARDIQKWDYVPLGPFLGKNFGSIVSPWIVTLDALEPFRVEGPKQDPEVLPYLQYEGSKNFDINLEVYIQPEDSVATKICTSNHKYLYWNINQQLAHQTVNGCNVNVGDMYASGTISGPTPDSFGSMLELSWGGQKSLKLDDGSERKFIADNDTIIMKAFAQKDGLRIGFGECVTKILPAK